MKFLKYALIALGGVFIYTVYTRFMAKRAAQKQPIKNTTADGRTPGVIGDLLSKVGGFFSTADNPSVPPIAGAYGAVGNVIAGDDTYVAIPSDSRVPSFLDGATGGVADSLQLGIAPPPVAGPPPTAGSGAYYAPQITSPTAITPKYPTLRAISLPVKLSSLRGQGTPKTSVGPPTKAPAKTYVQ
jgi:hypothetical protein